MEVSGGVEEGFVREWTPCSHILNLIPPRIQNGLFSNELCLTCVDAVSEYIALGTNVGLVYWYDRKKGKIQRLRCEAATSPITFVKIVSTVDYMVGAGNEAGQVTVFQIPKEHPENIPDTFKPKVEPKVERYTIGDLHKSKITAIEWSKNGMRLFSGDKNGVIIMTEIDFYMHLCKSMEIVNEEHEIVQMSYHGSSLLVSSVYRSIVCERRDARWHVNQIGKKDRKSLCALGAVFQHSYASGAPAHAYCARAGLRLWRADAAGNVLHTLLFKEAIANPLTVAELLNPCTRQPPAEHERALSCLLVYREQFLVSHDARALYVLDPRRATAVCVVDTLRRILSVCVTKDEIFVLEGPRSLVRLAAAPDNTAPSDEPLNLMSKSLTSSLQQAVSTVRELTQLHQTVPYLGSMLEQPLALLTKNELLDNTVASAEECFELPPIKHLPNDLSDNVLESIINEFKGVTSDAEELRKAKSEELQRKLRLYNSIVEQKSEEGLIHSRRSRRREGSGGSTPRHATPARHATPERHAGPGHVYTSPCLMNVSVYGNDSQNDDLLEKQIEEKEKILAKMLNLESLSITVPNNGASEHNKVAPVYKEIVVTSFIEPTPPKESEPENKPTPTVNSKEEPKAIDLVPKIVKLPNNWNLEDIELKLEMQSNGVKDPRSIMSPEDHIESDWEII